MLDQGIILFVAFIIYFVKVRKHTPSNLQGFKNGRFLKPIKNGRVFWNLLLCVSPSMSNRWLITTTQCLSCCNLLPSPLTPKIPQMHLQCHVICAILRSEVVAEVNSFHSKSTHVCIGCDSLLIQCGCGSFLINGAKGTRTFKIV